jgi:Icc-related predicted phosphoesterase
MKFGHQKMPDMERTIILPPHIFEQMHAYAVASSGEISGWGKTKLVRKGGNLYVVVTEIRIFQQQINSVHTQLRDEDLTKFYLSLIKSKERHQDWNLWWHSHDTMSVFFSPTDTDTIEKISKRSKLYSICINKKAEFVGRYDRKGEHVQDTPILIRESTPNQEILDKCAEEVAKLVTVIPAPLPAVSFGYNVIDERVDAVERFLRSRRHFID